MGRLINACVAAVGPELDPRGETFALASALMTAVGGGGADVDSRANSNLNLNSTDGDGGDGDGEDDDGDAARALEAATFLMQLALFAPHAAPPSALVPRLRRALRAGQPALRAAAAATLRHLCERDASAVSDAAAAGGGGAAAAAATTTAD